MATRSRSYWRGGEERHARERMPDSRIFSILGSVWGKGALSLFGNWLRWIVWRVSKNSMPYLACWLWASSHRTSCSHRIARRPVNHFTLLFFCFCEKFLLRKSLTFHRFLASSLKPFFRSASFHLYSYFPLFQANCLGFRRICLQAHLVCSRIRS